jgi:FAD/FMN-containing dehydrogenase
LLRLRLRGDDNGEWAGTDMTTYDIAGLKTALAGLKIEDNPAIVKQKSRDFFWYSPVLKRQLDHVTADIVVSPKGEAEVIRILKECFARGIPVTPRGSGTGNYGQAMPLSGGVILSLADMNRVKEIHRGRVVAEAGAILAEIDRQTRAHSQQELRLHPSTYNTASIAGFVAGGSGGIGSINWGGLRDAGNVLSLRVVTMEAEPRVMEVKGRDLAKVMHGIITEVEMPLEAAYDWIDVIVGFDDYGRTVRFANLMANQDGLLFKEIATVAAPVPFDYFLRHQKFLKREQSVALLMVAPHAMGPFLALAEREKAEILYRSDTATEAEKKGLPPVFELTWNHTTLRGLRVDPTITYLQVLYPFPTSVESVARMTAMFGDEVPGHLEFIRFDGNVAATGLPIVRFVSEARLDEIVRLHEANGCPIFNPHRYTLEEGGMKRTDAVQLAFKKEADPKGLLNPGKMIAWENPDFDLNSDKVYLFPGMQAAE